MFIPCEALSIQIIALLKAVSPTPPPRYAPVVSLL